MSVEIIKSEEFKGLLYNNRRFKIDDWIKVETDLVIDHTEGRLMCVIPEIESFSIEYYVDDHMEAKPFFLKDVSGISRLDDEEIKDFIEATSKILEPIRPVLDTIANVIKDKVLKNPDVMIFLNSSYGSGITEPDYIKNFESIELYYDCIVLKRFDRADTFKLGDIISIFVEWQPHSGRLYSINPTDNVITLEYELEHQTQTKDFKICDITNIK